MKEKDLILKVAERLAHKEDIATSYNEIAEIVLTYNEGWKYEGEEMIELIDKILSLKDDIIKSLNSTEKDLPF
jgi:acetaldehyde dehydrogenase (acetylating)